MPLNFGGETDSNSSSFTTQQLRQQLQPYFIDTSGDTLNATNDTITNVPNPVNAQDPVNLQYLQSYVTSNSLNNTSGNSTYLRLDGTNNPSNNISLNSNRLTNLANPVNSQDAVTLSYSNNTNSVTSLTVQQFSPIIYLDSFTSNNNINNQGSLSCLFSGVTNLPTLTPNSLNNLGVLTFDGVSQILQGNTTQLFQAPSTYIAVVRTNNVSGLRRIFDIGQNIGIGTSNNSLTFFNYAILNYITTTITITTNTWNIIVYRFNANFSVDFAMNGSLTYENIAGTSNSPNLGGNTMSIGYKNNNNVQYWNGDIAGIYIVTSALTNTQINQFVGILAFQFGLTSLLPSNHPYKLAPPLVRNSILLMNNFGISGIPNNTTDTTGAINLAQLNSAVNTLCSVSNNTAKPCITTDGTVSMTSNLSLNSNKVVSLANPTSTTDAANKTYVDTTVGNLYVGLFAQIIGTNNSSNFAIRAFSITNSLFTNLTALHPILIIYNEIGTSWNDSFGHSIRSRSLTGNTLSITYNIYIVNPGTVGWGQVVTCDILVFIR